MSEPDSIRFGLRRPEDRQLPIKLEDYTPAGFSPSRSEGSSTMSDTEENSEEEKALLDRITTWERVMSKMTEEEETFTCNWSNKTNDAIIKKYFKVRRKLLSPNELACQFFWNGSDTIHQKWVKSSDVQNLLSFLQLSTSVVDTKETDVLFPGGSADNFAAQMDLSRDIAYAVQDYAKFQDWKTLLDRVQKLPFRAIAEKMFVGVRDWLTDLGQIMTTNAATSMECVFQELTRCFIRAFGLVCKNGSTAKLVLPGRAKKCEPDLIFAPQYLTSPYWGVIEVKRMARDPAFLHFFEQPKKGIMKTGVKDPTESEADSPSVVEDECIPTKKRVTYPGRDDEVVEDECIPAKVRHVAYPEGDNEVDGADLFAPRSGGSALPAYVRDTVDIFFSQLFGQIISLDCHQPSQNYKRMGIGVVGFRIFFLAFYAKPGVPFAKIPETKAGKTEVHIAGPLCILDAKDREDIAQILLQLAVKELSLRKM